MRRLGHLAPEAGAPLAGSAGTGRLGEPAVVDIILVQFFPTGIIIPADKIVSSVIFLRSNGEKCMNPAKKLRRSPDGGYARGDETRHRIFDAAVELFGEYGFDGASTRDIAARAGVNAPALQYYFENKEGVYRACVEALADEAWKTFGPAIEHAQQVLEEEADVAELVDAFLLV